MACVPILSNRRNRYQFEANVLLHSLTAVPYVNAVTFAKLRLVNTRHSSQYSPRVEIKNNRVLWDTEHRFVCRFRSNLETNVLEPNILKISIRMETKGGKSFHKVGYVSVNLACFAAMGNATCRRRYILEGYDRGEHKRQDNSLLLVSFSLRQLQGDTCFRIPAENLAKCLIEPSPSSMLDPSTAIEELADEVSESLRDATSSSNARPLGGLVASCRQNPTYTFHPQLCAVMEAGHCGGTASRSFGNNDHFSTVPRTSPMDLLHSHLLNSQPALSASSAAMFPETLLMQLANLQAPKLSPLTAVGGQSLLLRAHDAGDAICVSCNQNNAATVGDAVTTLNPHLVPGEAGGKDGISRQQSFPSVVQHACREEYRSPSCPSGGVQFLTASYSPKSRDLSTDDYQVTDSMSEEQLESATDFRLQQNPSATKSIAAFIRPSDVSVCPSNSTSSASCPSSGSNSTTGDPNSPPPITETHDDLLDSAVTANGCHSLPNYSAKHQHRLNRPPAATGLAEEQNTASDYFATDSGLLMPSRRRRIRVDLPEMSPAAGSGPRSSMHGLARGVGGRLIDGQSSSSGYVSHSRQSSSDSQDLVVVGMRSGTGNGTLMSSNTLTPSRNPVACHPQTVTSSMKTVPDESFSASNQVEPDVLSVTASIMDG